MPVSIKVDIFKVSLDSILFISLNFILYDIQLASDGSNAFMNSLNMAMLWKCFGQNPAKWPQALSLVVLEIEVLTTTADLRKRLRFLQHIPLNSSIQLIEFELKGVVSKDIISEFNHQLSQRKRKRKDRLRHEIRRERLCMEAERIGNEERPKPKVRQKVFLFRRIIYINDNFFRVDRESF